MGRGGLGGVVEEGRFRDGEGGFGGGFKGVWGEGEVWWNQAEPWVSVIGHIVHFPSAAQPLASLLFQAQGTKLLTYVTE